MGRTVEISWLLFEHGDYYMTFIMYLCILVLLLEVLNDIVHLVVVMRRNEAIGAVDQG